MISQVYDIIGWHYDILKTKISYCDIICGHIWNHINENCVWYHTWYQDLAPHDIIDIWYHRVDIWSHFHMMSYMKCTYDIVFDVICRHHKKSYLDTWFHRVTSIKNPVCRGPEAGRLCHCVQPEATGHRRYLPARARQRAGPLSLNLRPEALRLRPGPLEFPEGGAPPADHWDCQSLY